MPFGVKYVIIHKNPPPIGMRSDRGGEAYGKLLSGFACIHIHSLCAGNSHALCVFQRFVDLDRRGEPYLSGSAVNIYQAFAADGRAD